MASAKKVLQGSFDGEVHLGLGESPSSVTPVVSLPSDGRANSLVESSGAIANPGPLLPVTPSFDTTSPATRPSPRQPDSSDDQGSVAPSRASRDARDDVYHGSGFPLAYTPVRVKDELPHFIPWHTNGSPDDSPFPSLCCPERPPPTYQTHLEGYWMVGSDGTMRWAEYPRTLNTLELPTNVSFEPHHWVGRLCPDFKLITETGPWLTVDHPRHPYYALTRLPGGSRSPKTQGEIPQNVPYNPSSDPQFCPPGSSLSRSIGQGRNSFGNSRGNGSSHPHFDSPDPDPSDPYNSRNIAHFSGNRYPGHGGGGGGGGGGGYPPNSFPDYFGPKPPLFKPKLDAKAYPELKSNKYFYEWNRRVRITLNAHGMGHLLDYDYAHARLEPELHDDRFRRTNAIFAILLQIVRTPTGIEILESYGEHPGSRPLLFTKYSKSCERMRRNLSLGSSRKWNFWDVLLLEDTQIL